MSNLPDFATLPFDGDISVTERAAPEPWATPEGIAVRSAYAASDIAGFAAMGGYPGLAPFVRGPYPTMYATNPWTIRQYAGFSTAEDSNAFYRRKIGRAHV